MKNILALLIVFALVSCASSQSKKSEFKSLVSSEIEKLAGDFIFTEGPAVDAKGNVYFTDLRAHLILIWTLDNKLDTFRINSGRANGLYFDKDENLLVCEGEKGQITSTSPEGVYLPLATAYEGKRFNQPNDLWPDGKGGIYFTDPKYGGGENELSQDGMHVYYIRPDRKSVIRVCDDLVKPNGVLGTPNGKILYVTDAKAGKTYKYDIKKDGLLANKALFVEFACDGMTIDKEGNVYLTTSGKQAVDIFSPSGELLESISVPEKPSNLCFGGKNRNQLFITARTSIYRVKLDTKGVD
ncbi:SMP-30/gluconolactonase/LRE family protein [Labilibaculum sp. DW002]|uniref:SMP-30/gluconolactonase/LRE family protein n=1 Tax=Paralabilibaculum antarcticum TaxID=2912572 RepID=A0ABT5VNG9_9BACT|nr:SMP-30/gluconolactonase/LRE family protein [Labilibaculum sp. DW002]MDE5416990.1 SMP-30/gluconolactonase/LRE family protein [Labilibaculum sp. DW002]